MKRCVRAGRKKDTSICRRRVLLQGYHEYERWLHHAIIAKLLTVPPRMRGPDSTHLIHCPLPPTGLRLSTYESCPAKDHLTITPISTTQDQEGAMRRKGRERARGVGGGVSSILPAKWFEVMFDNELWVWEMCRGHICIYRSATFEYFGFGRPFWCRAVPLSCRVLEIEQQKTSNYRSSHSHNSINITDT